MNRICFEFTPYLRRRLPKTRGSSGSDGTWQTDSEHSKPIAETLTLEIVTPAGTAYSEEVEMVTLPGVEGQMGIYPRHVPLLRPRTSKPIRQPHPHPTAKTSSDN